MPSIHFIRWIENLENSNYKLYWFDILDRDSTDLSTSIHKFTNWKIRKRKSFKGEYLLSNNFPNLYNFVKPLLENTENEYLEYIIKTINPDIIHSFEMQSCSYPILKTMNKYPKINWIYSCWGSDLFYYRNLTAHKNKIIKVLKRVNFLITDCNRDYFIAKELNFKGQFKGVIPGGSGYELDKFSPFYIPISERKLILIKGYQHNFGRAIEVVKSIQNCLNELSRYQIVLFSTHQIVIDYVKKNNLNFTIYNHNQLSQLEVMKLMGKSLIYIGNSISDGMPNTLLESIVMGSFPIQSNPGLVSEEIIENKKNGLIINDPYNNDEIIKCILFAINNFEMVKQAAVINSEIAKNRLEYNFIKDKINNIYSSIYK